MTWRSKEPGFPTFIPLIHVTRDEPDPAAFGLPQSALFKVCTSYFLLLASCLLHPASAYFRLLLLSRVGPT